MGCISSMFGFGLIPNIKKIPGRRYQDFKELPTNGGITAEDVTTIVKILVSDITVVENWIGLYERLGVSMDLDNLKKTRNAGNLNSTNLFKEIIEKWKSEQGIAGTVNVLCLILDDMRCVNASEKIKSFFSINEAGQSTNPIFFGFNCLSKNFTGRSEQINEIQKMLTEPTDGLVKILGMGGIGKTELAKKFAYINQECNCIWLDAENFKTLYNSVIELGEFVGVRNGNLTLKNLFRSCLKAITNRNSFKILVIVDNVDVNYDEAVEVIDVIKGAKNCSAIVTSRNIGVMEYTGDDIIDLDTFYDSEAIHLVSSSLTLESYQDILNLCGQLDNFPLALQQAIAFIKQTKRTGLLGKEFKIPHYLKLYEEEKIKLLNFPLIRDHKYFKTTLITWNTSIETIKAEVNVGKMSIDLLNIIAYLEAEGIHVKFIQKIYDPSDRSTPKVIAAIELLKAYSLVKVEGNVISVHRLVQEVVRVQLGHNKVLIKLITTIDKDNGLSVSRDGQLKHCLSVWRHFSQLKDDKLERKFMSKRIKFMNLQFLDPHVDRHFFNLCVEVANRVLCKDDKQRLIILSRFATCTKSVKNLEVVLWKQIEIKDQEEDLITSYSLAYTLFKLGEDQEALERLTTVRYRNHVWNQILLYVLDRLTVYLKENGHCHKNLIRMPKFHSFYTLD